MIKMTVRHLPKSVDCVDVWLVTVFVVDDWQLRSSSVYCVKPEVLNEAARSLTFVCTKQTTTETSTATQMDISRHLSRQSGRELYGYSITLGDTRPSWIVHVSHPVKHTTSSSPVTSK